MTKSIRIRAAEPDDVGTVLSLISELAEYERLADKVRGTEALLADGLYGPHATAAAVLAELDSEPVGFALYFPNFSTFECRPGLWLEDLYVKPEHRRAGIGRALLFHLARLACERRYARMEWTALDWNTPALRFYEAIGAQLLEDWRILRLDGTALEHAGSEAGDDA